MPDSVEVTNLHSQYVLGVKINTGLDLKSTVMYIDDVLLKNNKANIVCTTNPEIIMDCQVDSAFKSIINNSALSVPDGAGVVMAMEYMRQSYSIGNSTHKVLHIACNLLKGTALGLSSLLHLSRLPAKVSGVELAYKLCELAANKGYSVYLLGGWPRDWLGRNMVGNHNLASKAAAKLCEKYPGLRIVGSSSAYSSKETDDAASVSKIHSDMAKASVDKLDILLVAYNYNSQEKWIHRNSSKVPACVSIGVGGTFDYMAGNKSYSPAILRNSGLEWLFKLFTQPWRWRRISRAFPRFPIKVFFDSISH